MSLDRNNDGVIDRNEFKQWWTGNSDTTSKRAKGLDGVRTKLANKKGIFLGFTFAEYKKSKALDPSKIRQWPPKDVMLYLASRPELNVLRSDMDRDVWKDIDGETLLELKAEDLVEKRIKKYQLGIPVEISII